MGSNPSHFVECGERCSLDSVSWLDNQAFAGRLNEIEGPSATSCQSVVRGHCGLGQNVRGRGSRAGFLGFVAGHRRNAQDAGEAAVGAILDRPAGWSGRAGRSGPGRSGRNCDASPRTAMEADLFSSMCLV